MITKYSTVEIEALKEGEEPEWLKSAKSAPKAEQKAEEPAEVSPTRRVGDNIDAEEAPRTEP